MTIHQAKGLEFDTVFIVGMSEGIFPSHRSIRENGLDALEEERRLAYVAITRAKKELYLTESEGFSHEGIEKYPSRFIYEITPENLLNRIGFVSAELKKGLRNLIRQMNAAIAGGRNAQPGTRVTHPVFGKGEIISSEGESYRIFFEKLQKEKPIQKNFRGLVFEGRETIVKTEYTEYTALAPSRKEPDKPPAAAPASSPAATSVAKHLPDEEEKGIAEHRGKWSQEGVPHTGWVCIDIEDLGRPAAVCEMCESQEIRYVHYMQHKDYPSILKAGCVCAGHMENNPLRAKQRDDFMRSRAEKRKRWLTHRGWKISKKGNEWIEATGYIVVMKCQDSCWRALIKRESPQTPFEQWSRRKYTSKNEAKLAAFDSLTKILSDAEK
jgi:hypothetical protein